MSDRRLYLGTSCSLDRARTRGLVHMPARHLTTHGVILGMTGSGKTGLVTVMVEEALQNRIPVLVIDVKGDLPNLLLRFAHGDGAALAPWLERANDAEMRSTLERAAALAEQRRASLGHWGLHANDVEHYANSTHVRVITPGGTAGEPVHVLSMLERRSELWGCDEHAARVAMSASMSFLLNRMGRDADPLRSGEHVLLCALTERRFQTGQPAGVEALIEDLRNPPITYVGALELDEFMNPKRRGELAAALTAIAMSPNFASWRIGEPLDVRSWMTPKDGRTPAVVVSVAHLQHEDRMMMLGLVLEQVLAWVRSLPGTTDLRALVVVDELHGILPPYPHKTHPKDPLVTRIQQARAYHTGRSACRILGHILKSASTVIPRSLAYTRDAQA